MTKRKPKVPNPAALISKLNRQVTSLQRRVTKLEGK